jgi:hypothetical protein
METLWVLELQGRNSQSTAECSLSPYMINTGRAGPARKGAHINTSVVHTHRT